MTMTISELRKAITALRKLAVVLNVTKRYQPYLDDAVAAADGERSFTAYLKLANTAWEMISDAETAIQRKALSSLAYQGFSYCVDHSDGRTTFHPSRNRSEEYSRNVDGPVSALDALKLLRSGFAMPEKADSADGGTSNSVTLQVSDAPDTSGASVGATASASDHADPLFDEAVSEPLGRRLAEQLVAWRATNPAGAQPDATSLFERRLQKLLDAAEQGRRFGDLAVMKDDLEGIRSDLMQLEVPRRPHDLLERAAMCRNIASVEFGYADTTLFRDWRVAPPRGPLVS